MARGRKTGGRRKGTRNRATAEARAAAEASGILPLDYMLWVMRDPTADPKRRDSMAIAAAPYLHSKLSTADPPPAVTKEKPQVIKIAFVDPPQWPEDDEEGKT